jgi:D-alanyl-D-alanine carboxypeptidase
MLTTTALLKYTVRKTISMRLIMRVTIFTFLFLCFTIYASAQKENLSNILQRQLDSLRLAGNYPGISVAVMLRDNSMIRLVSGFADSARDKKMSVTDMMLQGSVGKTYVAAVTLQLVQEGKIQLDQKVAEYLNLLPWYPRVPNAKDITVRMLMNHTSGVMRYEFKEAFTRDLTNNPDKVWKPEELINYILDEKALFTAGEGWDYSDSNYILLAMILERITGKKYYELVNDRIWKPFGLNRTKPSDQKKLPGLVQGYAGQNNPFGGKDKMIDAKGTLIINPQFEWTGGGVYSTTSDLAKWGKLLYEGKLFNLNLLALSLNGTPAKMLGANTKYGLGVIIRQHPKLGEYYGHSGFFPGYMTEMYYFPSLQASIAVQANSSDFQTLKIPLLRILLKLAENLIQQ